MKTLTSTMPTQTPDTFPRWVLWTVGGLLSFCLISVGLVRITGNGPDQLAAAVSSERLLRFEDRSDGGISVIDGTTGLLLSVVQGEQGFMRGAVRALARERKTRNLGSDKPFQLIARTDGRLALYDPFTGHKVDLESFGPSNAAVFAPFLTMQPDSGLK